MIKFIELDARLIMVASKTIEINGKTVTTTGTIKILEALEARDTSSAADTPDQPVKLTKAQRLTASS